jgi:hypothetical protein
MFGFKLGHRIENPYVVRKQNFDKKVAALNAKLSPNRAFSDSYDERLFFKNNGGLYLRGPGNNQWNVSHKMAPINQVRDLCRRLEVMQELQIPSLDGGGRRLSVETLLKKTKADQSAFDMDQIEARMVAACGFGTLHNPRTGEEVPLTYRGTIECRPVPYLYEVLQSAVRVQPWGSFKTFVNPDLDAKNPPLVYPIRAD